MEYKFKGNPGTGNTFQDTRMEQVANYNPNALQVTNNFQAPVTRHRLTKWYERLEEEARNNVRIQRKLGDLRRYHTRLPKTIGLEAKLQDAGFGRTEITSALRSKQAFSKKSMRYQYFESAQRIDDYLFAKVCHLFDIYVMPLIREGKPLDIIRRAAYEQVVGPVVEEVNTHSGEDSCLTYNVDDIYGMLYYLTGKCHINWADYDLHPRL